MGGSGNKCSYAKCPNSKRRSGISFFTFPINDKARCQIWKKNCGNTIYQLDSSDLKKKIICERHFSMKDIYKSGSRQLLRKNAIPIKFTEPAEKKANDSTFVIPISPTERKYESPTDDPVLSTSGIQKTYPGKGTSIAGYVLSTSSDIPEKQQHTDSETDSFSSNVSSTVTEIPPNSELILLRDKCKKLELQTERLRKVLKSKNGKISLLQRKASRKNSAFQQSLHHKRSSSNTTRADLRKPHRTANSSRQGSDKDEDLTLSSLLSDSKPDEERCSLLPEEISESGAEVLSLGSDPSDVEFAQDPKTAYFSPSSSTEVYNTGFPSSLSSSDNWLRKNETELETSSLSNPSLLSGVINDACTKFFQSMVDTVRDLPPDLQILAKRKVLHAITEYELTALNRLNVPKN